VAKQDYRSRKVERTHGRVRVEGKKGSKQGKLRHDLYKCLHDRLAEANEQAMYFEIIAICDMLITDRLEAYTQYLLFDDDFHFPTQSIGGAIGFLGTAVADKAPEVAKSASYIKMRDEVEEFVKMRNEVLHAFIIVKNVASDVSLKERLVFAEHTAEVGNKLVRDVSEFVSKHIKITD